MASQVGSGRNLWINSKIVGNPVVEALPSGHITGQSRCYKLTNNQELLFNIEPDFSSRLFRKVTFSAWVKYENVVRGANSWNMFNCFRHYMFFKNSKTGTVSDTSFLTLAGYDGTSDWKRIVFTYDYSTNKGYDQLKTLLKFNLGGVRSGTAWITGVQVEFGGVANEYAPATEDVESLITEAKATFERTAQGLRTDLSAVQAYVSADGTRAEALRTYSREETARQLTAERKLIEAGYVGIAQHTEDVKGISRRFEELKSSSETKLAEFRQGIDGQLVSVQAALNTANGSLTSFNNWKQSAQETLNKVGRVETGLNETKTSFAEFKRTAEGQLTTITQQVAGKVSQTELNQRANQITQAVQELSNSVLRKSQVKINEGGIISSVEKTVNGQTLASMIAQSPENVEIIARLLKVKGDMIVNGSVTVDKLNIEGELSALSGKLGRVTSGEIINEYETPYTRGEIRIADNIQITNHNKSGPRSNLGKEEIKMLPNGILMNAYDTNEKPIHTMQVSPDVISYQRLNYSLKGGGTGSWDLAYSNGYSALNIDTVNQKIRLQAESSLMWGVNATFLRIGNLVTVSVTRIICNINEIIENGKARERIPSGFRPISQTHLTLTGNFNTTIDATCIVHLETDGSIRFTNNKTGNRVWTGTVSYTTVDEFPLAGDVPKGKII